MQTQLKLFDVIIVGAGPAGTAAAYRALENKLSVLLLDRTDIPADKPCAGGLTLKTLALMPYSVASVIEHVTTGLDIGIENGQATRLERFDRGADICAFAVRAKFDALNFKKTIEKGAQFVKIRRLDQIKQSADHVELTCGEQTYRAKYLIGADGANSKVRRMTCPNNGFHRGFAVEGLVPYDALQSRPYAEFLLGVVQSGYGWVFPKGDHANVGIYTNRDDVPLSKEQLRHYSRTRLNTDVLDHIKGYPLGFGGEHFWQVEGRVVLVGDAGGYAEPLLGEGLHNAVLSGQCAAQAIVDIEEGATRRSLKAHYKNLSTPVRKDVKRCRDIAHQIIYPRLNGMGGKVLMHPVSRYVLLQGFAAGITTHKITNRFMLAGLMRPQHVSSLQEFHTPL